MRPNLESTSFPQPIAEEVVEIGDVVNLADGDLEIVIDPAIADALAVVKHVTGPRVEVARLPDRADVAKGLSAVEVVIQADIIRRQELQALGEDAGDVRVPLKAIFVNQRENLLHLALVINVFRENIFVERVAGR